MDRVIKFRGKARELNKWVYGSFFNGLQWADFIIEDAGFENRVAVLSDTVGQFTGLLDKNGKEIYEGDILESRYDDSVSILGYCLVRNKVSYNQGTFGVIGEVTGDLMPFFDYPLQDEYVIGNIHDNPELLEGGEE